MRKSDRFNYLPLSYKYPIILVPRKEEFSSGVMSRLHLPILQEAVVAIAAGLCAEIEMNPM